MYMKECKKCNKKYDDNLSFCPICGSELCDIHKEIEDSNCDVINIETDNNLPVYEQTEFKLNMKKIAKIQRIKFLLLVLFIIFMLTIPYLSASELISTSSLRRGYDFFSLIMATIGSFVDTDHYIAPLNGGFVYLFLAIYAVLILIPALVILIKLKIKANKGDFGEKEFYESTCNKESNKEAKLIMNLEKNNANGKFSLEKLMMKGFYGLASMFYLFFFDALIYPSFDKINAFIIIPLATLIAIIVFAIIESSMKNKFKKFINEN